MNRAADRAGSSENPVNLGPVDALRIGRRNRRKHGAAGGETRSKTPRKTPEHADHDSSLHEWGGLARLTAFAVEAGRLSRPRLPRARKEGRIGRDEVKRTHSVAHSHFRLLTTMASACPPQATP
jgi:hypothetical protein